MVSWLWKQKTYGQLNSEPLSGPPAKIDPVEL